MRSMVLVALVAVGAVLAGCTLLAGCTSDEAPEPTPVTAAGLAGAIHRDALLAHLDRLQQIARDHDGNRAAGTSGYDASVDYVRDRLTERGFEVQTPEFEFSTYSVAAQSMSAGGREFPADPLTFAPATPPAGITARPVRVPDGDRPGCEPADYDGLDVAGAIALIPRGDCTFTIKQQIAADRGAVAAVIVDPNGPVGDGTLGDPQAGRIPTLGMAGADADRMLQAGGPATMRLDATSATTRTRNVVAQTTTGSTDDVVLVGAHLDSVPAGPGINDNGTGTAAILETALQLGAAPKVTNAVRFAWWGAEELGLLGSERYVNALSAADRSKIALYLNFDMLGSPNFGYFAYDGDDSDQQGEPAGPEGPAGIERTFVGYLQNQRHVAVEGADFDGRSDYGPFIEHGIPAGGVDSGADATKTEEQAAKWGGRAGETFDPNYHSSRDTVQNVDLDAFERNAAAVAFGTATYALSLTGPDGVPTGPGRASARSLG